MSTRIQRDKEKKQQEEFQAILRRLLLEEDNKYCADCDAKGPRWASWNIGVFLCIRCAGIHRNLGVHISKVKSVNLDTWTEKQTLSIESLGNRSCRRVYEADLPSSFRRPQTDSALEHFIRAKYEHKKYVDRELEKQLLTLKRQETPKSEPEKKKKNTQDQKPVTLQKLAKAPGTAKSRSSPTKVQLAPLNASSFQRAKPSQPGVVNSAPATPPKTNSSMDDLLGLDTPKVTNNNDLFAMPIPQQTPSVAAQTISAPQMVASSSAPSLSSPSQPPATNGIANDVDLFGQETSSSSSSTSGKTSKESILALFGNQPSQQQQMYNVPGGMYIPSQQQNHAALGNSFGQPQMMMNQQQQQQPQQQPGYQQGMMGMPAGQPGMMGVNMGYNPMQQQQAYLQQVQAQMQNMRIGGNPGMTAQMTMNGQNPQQMQQPPQQQQQQPAQAAWNSGMYPTMQQAQGVPVQGNMGWNGNMAGQTLSTQLWK
ncbi:stromal membrane-associated protein 1-like isoform X2 [Apostichopus japonicus]|uniref:stromal membrane-associated protein 1-like isoform X2 n=1 Tax=Stichopus japonicus TaxID=307972 RepID=UPI003AB3592C